MPQVCPQQALASQCLAALQLPGVRATRILSRAYQGQGTVTGRVYKLAYPHE